MTMLTVPYALGQVGVSGTPDRFADVGFTVSDNGLVSVLNGALAFSGSGESGTFLGIGVVGDEVPAGVNIDGISVVNSVVAPPVNHSNGAFELDHLVVLTPDLDQTIRHTEAVLGIRQLRLAEEGGRRQSFHRFADVTHPDGTVTKGCLLELVAEPKVSAATLWGVVFNTYRLEAIAEGYGPQVIRPPRPAVQKGRLIAPFAPEAGLGIQVAMMSPVPPSVPAANNGSNTDGG